MNDALLSAFEEELAILYERAEEFAAEFPGVAEGLGSLKRDTADPGIRALLEGAAFMAAASERLHERGPLVSFNSARRHRW